jgi:hypothetical protein
LYSCGAQVKPLGRPCLPATERVQRSIWCIPEIWSMPVGHGTAEKWTGPVCCFTEKSLLYLSTEQTKYSPRCHQYIILLSMSEKWRHYHMLSLCHKCKVPIALGQAYNSLKIEGIHCVIPDNP